MYLGVGSWQACASYARTSLARGGRHRSKISASTEARSCHCHKMENSQYDAHDPMGPRLLVCKKRLHVAVR